MEVRISSGDFVNKEGMFFTREEAALKSAMFFAGVLAGTFAGTAWTASFLTEAGADFFVFFRLPRRVLVLSHMDFVAFGCSCVRLLYAVVIIIVCVRPVRGSIVRGLCYNVGTSRSRIIFTDKEGGPMHLMFYALSAMALMIVSSVTIVFARKLRRRLVRFALSTVAYASLVVAFFLMVAVLITF